MLEFHRHSCLTWMWAADIQIVQYMLIPSQLEIAACLKMNIRSTFYLTENNVYFLQKDQDLYIL